MRPAATRGQSSVPDVSVVIPVRDGAESLPVLLASLDAQTLPRERFEVVVVDNGSRDATADIARAAGATLAVEPIANRSRARNAGIAVSRAPLVAFTDVDCVAAPDWLAALLRCEDRAPLVAGHVETTTRPEPNAVERLERAWRFAQEHWVRLGWAATANLAVRRRTLEVLGGFDPVYRHIGEDADLCLRAVRAGFPLAFCASAVVFHDAETTLRPMLKRSFRHGYGAHQARRRLGTGHVAWYDPAPVVWGPAALRRHGVVPEALARAERRRLGTLAQASYAARIVGSAWAELRRAR